MKETEWKKKERKKKIWKENNKREQANKENGENVIERRYTQNHEKKEKENG